MPKTMSMAIVCGVAAVVLVCGVAVVFAQGASKKPPVSHQEGKITFNTQTHAVGAQPDTYKVPNGEQLELTLTLDVKGPGEAEFANPPVVFPHGDPPDFHWTRKSATEIVLTELNDNQKPGENDTYYFKARVKSGGEVYQSPDPTIINVGPPGG